MNPFAYIHRPAVLILDFDEASGFRTGRPVKHDVHKHDFIMRLGSTGGIVGRSALGPACCDAARYVVISAYLNCLVRSTGWV